jgi:hypothetical protein
MKKSILVIQNQNGAVMMLVSLMLVALLTIVGIAASRTASTEVKIAGNEYLYQRSFYRAEGAIMEVVHRLETSLNPAETLPTWMDRDDTRINEKTVFDYWADDDPNRVVVPHTAVVDNDHTSFMAVHHTIGSGNSLDMSKPTKHTFSIYGRSQDRGQVILKVGFSNVYE